MQMRSCEAAHTTFKLLAISKFGVPKALPTCNCDLLTCEGGNGRTISLRGGSISHIPQLQGVVRRGTNDLAAAHPPNVRHSFGVAPNDS